MCRRHRCGKATALRMLPRRPQRSNCHTQVTGGPFRLAARSAHRHMQRRHLRPVQPVTSTPRTASYCAHCCSVGRIHALGELAQRGVALRIKHGAGPGVKQWCQHPRNLGKGALHLLASIPGAAASDTPETARGAAIAAGRCGLTPWYALCYPIRQPDASTAYTLWRPLVSGLCSESFLALFRGSAASRVQKGMRPKCSPAQQHESQRGEAVCCPRRRGA